MDIEAIFKSKAMKDLLDLATRIAKYPTTVLIEGETGVGKEVLANWIHQKSPRSNMPFIKLNCGAIPENLIESELFGYEKGAFTGAKREGSPGLFELADNGTLLLDEIAELSPTMQVKILRVLQDREVRRVGGSWSKTVDVRIIACTNQNLKTLAESNRFRKDLYYRLNVAYILIPPLRERKEDILPLLNYFLNKNCTEFNFTKRFTSESLELLMNHNYPGNVRELGNLVEGACISAIGSEISPELFSARISKKDKNTSSLQSQIEETERRAIKSALLNEPSIRKAAKYLEISNATLLRKMKKYGIK